MRSPSAALLLAGVLCCAAAGQQPAAPQQPPPGAPPRDMAKDQTPAAKPHDWPSQIEGKNIKDVLTAIEKETDPQGREVAVRMLPLFGPPGQKVLDKNGQNLAARVLLRAMEKERDPAVRLAAYHTAALIGFVEESDTKEAVRILGVAVEGGAPGGQTRYHAAVALAGFGHKAEAAVPNLTGVAIGDPAYETRRAIASTLGRIAFHEHRGPSVKALNTLCTKLANDTSAAVRMEAMHSVVLLGPPFQPRLDSAPLLKDVKDAKDAPKANEEAVRGFVAALKKRITATQTGGKIPETEKPVEIWCRLAIMRLEPKEITDDHLNGIAKFLARSETDVTAKLQALAAFSLMGEIAAKKMNDIMRVLDDPNPVLVEAALKALVAMGTEAKGAIPAIESIKGRGKDKEEKEMYAKWVEDAVKMIKMAKAPDKK